MVEKQCEACGPNSRARCTKKAEHGGDHEAWPHPGQCVEVWASPQGLRSSAGEGSPSAPVAERNATRRNAAPVAEPGDVAAPVRENAPTPAPRGPVGAFADKAKPVGPFASIAAFVRHMDAARARRDPPYPSDALVLIAREVHGAEVTVEQIARVRNAARYAAKKRATTFRNPTESDRDPLEAVSPLMAAAAMHTAGMLGNHARDGQIERALESLGRIADQLERNGDTLESVHNATDDGLVSIDDRLARLDPERAAKLAAPARRRLSKQDYEQLYARVVSAAAAGDDTNGGILRRILAELGFEVQS